MTANAGLRPLSHLDLNGRAGLEIILVDAEAAGCYLDDGIRAVLIKILV